MAEGKAPVVTFKFQGAITLDDGVTLEQALSHLRELKEKAQELGVADMKVGIPRLTNVGMDAVLSSTSPYEVPQT